ncbi:MAG: OmpH family outer membrane protein [Deferrisomatales bacterium]
MARRDLLTGIGAALLALLLSATGAAAELKIGVVDLQRCLNESQTGKQYKAEFTAEAERMKAELEREEESLKVLREELEKQGMILSETARAEKERSYRERLDAFRERFQQSQQVLQRRDQELTRRILTDLQGVIRELGETGGYALILERGEGGVLYAPTHADLTDEVVRRYDKSRAEE